MNDLLTLAPTENFEYTIALKICRCSKHVHWTIRLAIACPVVLYHLSTVRPAIQFPLITLSLCSHMIYIAIDEDLVVFDLGLPENYRYQPVLRSIYLD